MNDEICRNCGYFDPEDQKCYFFVDQQINFDGGMPIAFYAQPEDDACEVYTPIRGNQNE